jgi:hypothetical protein
MQWYPGDWRKDIAIQSLSFHDRGVWFEMLMLMHDSEQRGILMLNGNAMTEEMIARAIGLDIQMFNQTLTNLLTTGVAQRDPKTNSVMNKRMVHDEEVRKIHAEAGKKGGNPVLVNQKKNQTPNQTANQNLTPSSSSSSSNKEHRDKPLAVSFSLPLWVHTDTWQDFEAHRGKLRKPMTDRARRDIIAKLDGLRAKARTPRPCLRRVSARAGRMFSKFGMICS